MKNILQVFVLGICDVRSLASLFIALAVHLLIAQAAHALGTPIPVSDAQQVIYVLPQHAEQPVLRALQIRLRANPGDEAALIELGERYLALAAASGDERYLGYAEQLLVDRKVVSRSAAVTVLHARLLQRPHKFAEAMTVLAPLLTTSQRHADAHLLAAFIEMARGDAAAALPYCTATLSISPTQGIHCIARAQALQGHALAALEKLTLLQQSGILAADERRELPMTRAEIAARLGRDDLALPLWRQLLQDHTQTVLVRQQLADLYLRSGRHADVMSLLTAEALPVSLQLRKTIAARALNDSHAATLHENLRNYFSVAILRDADYASRDHALYLLHVENNAAAALDAAWKNWNTQREPDDALVVLEAAAAAGKSNEAVRTVALWQQRTHLEDVRIDTALANR